MRSQCIALWLTTTALLTSAGAQAGGNGTSEPLTIQEQGSFAVGGKVTTNPGSFNPKQPTPEGQTLHGDHAYVFYQIPVNRRKLPLVFLHGTGQFSKTWETTPDGREGFQTIFLRRHFSVYLIDRSRNVSANLPIPAITPPLMKGKAASVAAVTPERMIVMDAQSGM